MRFYFGFLIHISTALFIWLLATTKFDTVFGILIVISFILGIILTQFSKTAMNYLDGLLLLIFQCICIAEVVIAMDIPFGSKVIN